MTDKIVGLWGNVNWGHVGPRYCVTCAGYGKIGGYRWRYDPASGAMVQVDQITCPRCEGTGRAKTAKR